MTGREALEKRMLQLGATKLQVGAKVIDLVLLALADGDNRAVVEEIEKAQRELKLRKASYEERERRLDSMEQNFLEDLPEKKRKLNAELQEVSWRLERATNALKQANAEIDDMEKKREGMFKDFETAEARDRFRLLQTYNENVPDVEDMNGYERTAYIKGAAQILGRIGEKGEE